MRRVLVAGAAGWGNVGDDWIARELVELAEAEGATEVQLLAGPLALTTAKKPETVYWHSRFLAIWVLIRSDLILIGGGGLLDDRRHEFYRPFYRLSLACRLFRKPYKLVGVGIEEPRSAKAEQRYRAIISNAREVFSRDLDSHSLAERLSPGSSTYSVDLSFWRADPADPLCRSRSAARRAIANLRPWWHVGESFQSEATREKNLLVLFRRVRRLLAESQVEEVLLQPMTAPGAPDDDNVVLQRFADGLKIPHRWSEASVETMLGEIRAADVAIGMRLHFVLAAIKLGTPITPIAYDRKIEAYATRAGLKSNSVDADEVLVPAAVATPLKLKEFDGRTQL